MKPKLSKRMLTVSLGTSPLWVKPVMQSVILPAHAQTSNGLGRITNAIANCGSGVIDLTGGKSISITVDFYVERESFVTFRAFLVGERIPSDVMACTYLPAAGNLDNRAERQFNQGRHIIDIPLFAMDDDDSEIIFNLDRIDVLADISGQPEFRFTKTISCRAIGVGYLDCPS